MNLNKLRDEAYSTAKEHGWHDKEHSDEHCLMLILTEIAEAVNADRKNEYAQRRMFEINAYTPQPNPEQRWMFIFEKFIKGSLEEELADVVIRCLDLAGLRDIDLTHALDSLDELPVTTFGEWTFTETAYDMCFPVVTENAEAAVLSTIKYVFHYCKAKGIDIEWFIEQKMKYNKLRPYRHGGKKY